MKVRIVTELEPLAEALTEVLEAKGFEVEHVEESVRATEIRYGEGVGDDVITQLIDAIKPLLPSVALAEGLDLCGAAAGRAPGPGRLGAEDLRRQRGLCDHPAR
ncbi:MAG: hypothetical protein H6702_08795 [Myxococcales bacterium]|nr:hypothetical protein [Myxococcales bacterium]